MEQNIEQQFLELVRIVNGMQQRILSLENANQVLVRSNKQLIELMEEKQAELSDYQRNAFFELQGPPPRSTGREKQEYWFPKIVSVEETVAEIVEKKKSLARFGDGEFSTIAGRVRHRFQSEVDEGLRQRLLEVLQSEEENLLIGLADNYGSLETYTEQAKREIRRYLAPQVRREHLRLLKPEKTYYNAYVTRPYVMYEDREGPAAAERFLALRQIWDQRDCIFVEGCRTGLGVGNDLFQNARSIRRILGPAENAFTRYDRILECCLSQDKETLFLLALGPAATVLAYDLSRAGIQAVDVGHVDLEYEWFLRGEGRRTPVPGKYNNEMEPDQPLLPITDAAYTAQRIGDFL